MTQGDERILRHLLWIRHGCNFGALYGDDGEMQCNACSIDFKRDSPEEILKKFDKTDMAKLASTWGVDFKPCSS